MRNGKVGGEMFLATVEAKADSFFLLSFDTLMSVWFAFRFNVSQSLKVLLTRTVRIFGYHKRYREFDKDSNRNINTVSL